MPVAFVDVAHQCAPQIEAETLAAVVSVESGFRPFAIRINSDRAREDEPQTRVEAIKTASILIADGIDVDLGLGGINSSDLGHAGLQLAVKAGATERQAETVMLRSYFGRGNPALGEMVGYDGRVLAERERLGPRLSSIEISQEQPDQPHWSERAQTLAVGSDAVATSQHTRSRSETSTPQWDVFNSGRRPSVLVFSNEQQE